MIPQDLQDLIADLDDAPSKDVALRKAYDVLAEKFPGKRLTAFLLPWRLFVKDHSTIWHKYKRVPSTSMNDMLRLILVNTKWFSEEDITLKWTFIWLTPHQYVSVTCDDHNVNIDVWGANFKVPYGEYARGMV